MRTIPVRNKELLNILNEYPKLREHENFKEYLRLFSASKESESQADYYT